MHLRLHKNLRKNFTHYSLLGATVKMMLHRWYKFVKGDGQRMNFLRLRNALNAAV